jgi:hypothetical protein
MILSVNYLFVFKVSGCGAEGCFGLVLNLYNVLLALFSRPHPSPRFPQILFTLSDQDSKISLVLSPSAMLLTL